MNRRNWIAIALSGLAGFLTAVFVSANTADAAEMCCVPGPGFAFCHKIVVGAQCGDHSGTCGAPCAGALASACADDHLCWGIPMDDPEAHCASLCGTDDDCVACADPDDPAARFVCQPFPAGGRWCAKE